MKTNQRFIVSRNKREGKYFGMFGCTRHWHTTLKSYVRYLKLLKYGAW